MPLVIPSKYQKRPSYLFSAHLETIVPSVFFKAPTLHYERERLELEDGDFLDLDWLKQDNKKCMVITHGLEGSSDRYYVKRTAQFFHSRGWDILTWNCRSCSGEMNRLPRFYHHGDTDDLAQVVDQATSKNYEHVILFGYSMGGSMSLKYLGEKRHLHPSIKGATTFSVPCNLRDSAVEIHKKGNRFYERRFLEKVVDKMKIKSKTMPEIDISGIDELPDFDSFHERYTVPLHGFSSLDDFYNQSTCDQYLSNIKKPVLIVNAQNDPMLGDKCYPRNLAQQSEHVHLEIPRVGGHVGFTLSPKNFSWMEYRAEEFILKTILP
ncbi:MAG: alpha/beta fold hydrolase [Cyclobacteriaceae bacterium]